MTQNASIQNNVQAIERSLTKKDIIAILSQKLHNNLNSYYPDLDKDRALINGKSLGGHVASTYRFEITSGNNSKKNIIFIKLCPIFEALNPALMEYQTLQLLYHKMPLIQKDCYVPRPLDYFPDLHAYAMESVGTKNFKAYLLKNNFKFWNDNSLTELFSIVSGCAHWLRAFHEITKAEKSVKFNSTSFLLSLNEAFDYRSLKKFKFKKQTLVDLDGLIKNLSLLDGKFDLPCAKWHWDYTPGHVFIDNNRISVIDILGIDNTPIFEDIGRFLAAMSTVNNLPFYPFFDHNRANGLLCDRFIESYLSETEFNGETFMLIANIYKLKYLITLFHAQHFMVSIKIHPIVANIFANFRLVRLFEESISYTIEGISKRLKIYL